MTTEYWYIKRTPKQPPRSTRLRMIFTQIISALALTAATVSAIELKNKHCAPKCKGINCLETLARINFEPKWCGAELMEKLARRSILRPDINWNYNPLYDTTSPCTLMSQQDPSLSVAVVNSEAEIICSTFSDTAPEPIYINGTTDYSYPVHAAWATNQVKYVNYDQQTIVAVPLYFRDGSVETVVFAKANSELPVVCCEDPNPALTQCRRFTN